MYKQQPMKMAAAEGLCNTEQKAGFSLFAIGNPGPGHCDVTTVTIPGVYSFLATGDFGATVSGVNQLQEQYSEKYGDGTDYVPVLAVTYWNFRLMIGFGMIAAAMAVLGLWVTARDASRAAGSARSPCSASRPRSWPT